jgi:O-antigen/teichoic acid export membrane protein
MRLLVIIALPFSLMLMAGCGLILKVFLGPDTSDEAILALRILSLIIAISFPSLVIRNIFIALGRQKLDTLISAAALGMNIVLMIALVPPFGVLGAVVAIFTAEIFLFAIGIFYVYRLGFRLDFVGVFVKPILCSIPLIIAMVLTPREGVIGPRLALYLGCIVVYAILIFIIRSLSRDDIDNLRRVTRGDDPVWHNNFGSHHLGRF